MVGVRKYVSGDIEIDFYNNDEITEYRYSSDPAKPSNIPQEIAQTLATTLATDICAEIFFGDDDLPTHVELEECDYDSYDDDDDDEDEEDKFE